MPVSPTSVPPSRRRRRLRSAVRAVRSTVTSKHCRKASEGAMLSRQSPLTVLPKAASPRHPSNPIARLDGKIRDGLVAHEAPGASTKLRALVSRST